LLAAHLSLLDHSILARFNGGKRDTRHARRRASLATASKVIPTDSRHAAPRCHVAGIMLSTAVMRFDAFFAAQGRSEAQICRAARKRSHRLGRVNEAPTQQRVLDRSAMSFQNHGADWLRAVRLR